jgi:hypothetical protein
LHGARRRRGGAVRQGKRQKVKDEPFHLRGYVW